MASVAVVQETAQSVAGYPPGQSKTDRKLVAHLRSVDNDFNRPSKPLRLEEFFYYIKL